MVWSCRLFAVVALSTHCGVGPADRVCVVVSGAVLSQLMMNRQAEHPLTRPQTRALPGASVECLIRGERTLLPDRNRTVAPPNRHHPKASPAVRKTVGRRDEIDESTDGGRDGGWGLPWRVHTEPAVKGDDDGDLSDTPLARKRNREAVRKYRQRKREQTQSLTQEVEQLRADNARLLAELAQHNKLKEELRVLRMVVNSVSSVRLPVSFLSLSTSPALPHDAQSQLRGLCLLLRSNLID